MYHQLTAIMYHQWTAIMYHQWTAIMYHHILFAIWDTLVYSYNVCSFLLNKSVIQSTNLLPHGKYLCWKATYFDKVTNSTISAYTSVRKFKERDQESIQLTIATSNAVIQVWMIFLSFIVQWLLINLIYFF